MAALEGTLKLPGGHMRFRLSGREGAPTVMFCNGIMADMSLWDAVASRLEPDWQVLRYDMRGHGGSDAPDGSYTIGELADDALGLVRRLGLARVHLVGISLGAMVALQMAVQAPSSLATVTLSNTGTRLPEGVREAWDQRVEQARRGEMAAIANATLQRWFLPDFLRDNAQQVAVTRSMLLATSQAGYAGCASAIRDMAIDALPPLVRVPTLVLHGRSDPAWPLEGAQALADRIPGAQFAVIDGAAHMPCIEQPVAFTDHWRVFASRHATNTSTSVAGPLLPALDADTPGMDRALVDLIRKERGGHLLMLYKVLLNSQPVAFGWLKLFTALRQQTRIDGRIRELVILRVATLNGAEYEFDAHVPFAMAEGFSAADIEDVRVGRFPGAVTDREAAALAYTDSITRQVRVPSAVFERVRALFDDRELLELTVLAAAYNLVSRVLVALNISSEH